MTYSSLASRVGSSNKGLDEKIVQSIVAQFLDSKEFNIIIFFFVFEQKESAEKGCSTGDSRWSSF